MLFITTLLCGITLVTGLSWVGVIDMIGEHVYQCWSYLLNRYQQTDNEQKAEPVLTKTTRTALLEPTLSERVIAPSKPPVVVARVEPPLEKKKIEIDPSIKLEREWTATIVIAKCSRHIMQKKHFPNISFEELSQLVEQRLSDFGVEVKVVAVHPGPVITRFELELAPGIKVSKITGLAKDIARSLSTVSVRIVEVIPGKSVIGLKFQMKIVSW